MGGLAPLLLSSRRQDLTPVPHSSKSNFVDKLRTQYQKRLPRASPFTAEATWRALPLLTRVQVLHQLCEWQLADPMRFRALLKSEEDAVQWRIEPCGWDKEGNMYWLFDGGRTFGGGRMKTLTKLSLPQTTACGFSTPHRPSPNRQSQPRHPARRVRPKSPKRLRARRAAARSLASPRQARGPQRRLKRKKRKRSI